MKTKILLLVVAFATLSGMSSCKKCYTCTTTNKCITCDFNGSNSGEICEADNASAYDAYRQACLANGGTINTTSNDTDVDEFCETNKNNVSVLEDNCEDD